MMSIPKAKYPLSDLAVQAMKSAAEDAIAEHARTGVPLYYLRGGKIVEVDARRLLANRKAAARRAAKRAAASPQRAARPAAGPKRRAAQPGRNR